MEVVGLVVGLAPVVVQIVQGTKKLREAWKSTGALPSKLEALTEELEFLAHVAELIDRLDDSHSINDVVAAHCRRSLEKVANELERLSEDLIRINSSKGLNRVVRKAQLASICEEKLGKLETHVHYAQSKLQLGLAHFRAQSTITQQSITACGEVFLASEQDSQGLAVVQRPSPQTLSHRPRTLSTRSGSCASRGCECTCHTKGSFGGRFWSFHYTPLSMMIAGCDKSGCNGKQYSVSCRLALSQFGLNWAMTAVMGMRSGGGSYSLEPPLHLQRIVRYTSEGFLLLSKMLHGLTSLDDGISKFRILRRKDPSMVHHVNPAGRGYIEELLMCPKDFIVQERLLRLFIDEFRMKQGLDDVSLLYRCALWIGEGPHLAIFNALLALGYDPSFLEGPQAKSWPKPCDPNWISEKVTPDPFFIELLSKLAKVDPEFGGISSLQHKVLCGLANDAQTLVGPMDTLDMKRNFLGQTSLHLAVTQEHVVSALLHAHHPVDERDIFGLTPLMYAAGSGQTETAKQLISAEADLFIKCGRFQRDFMSYAFVRGQWKFVVDIIRYLQAACPTESTAIGQYYAARALVAIAAEECSFWETPDDTVEGLAQLAGEDINITINDSRQGVLSNHLLHYECSLSQVKIIMDHGFSLLNHKNSLGRSALMFSAQRGDPAIISYYIKMGAEVNDLDSSGMSALAHCLRGWQEKQSPFGFADETFYPEETSYSKVARILLDAGADFSSMDGCNCACSAFGCTIVHTLPPMFNADKNAFWSGCDIWVTVEWLHLLEERQDHRALRFNLIALLRVALFEEMGLTHTCCRLRLQYERPGIPTIFDPKMPSIDERIAINAQQEQSRNQLDLEMQRMAELDTADLMRQWQQSLFRCHLLAASPPGLTAWRDSLKARDKYAHDCTNDREKLCGDTEREQSPGWTVDEKNDSFHYVLRFPSPSTYRQNPFSASLSYLADLEERFDHCRMRVDKQEMDAWYARRLSWMMNFLAVLEVPLLYARTGLQGVLKRRRDATRASAMMTHFSDSTSRTSGLRHL